MESNSNKINSTTPSKAAFTASAAGNETKPTKGQNLRQLAANYGSLSRKVVDLSTRANTALYSCDTLIKTTTILLESVQELNKRVVALEAGFADQKGVSLEMVQKETAKISSETHTIFNNLQQQITALRGDDVDIISSPAKPRPENYLSTPQRLRKDAENLGALASKSGLLQSATAAADTEEAQGSAAPIVATPRKVIHEARKTPKSSLSLFSFPSDPKDEVATTLFPESEATDKAKPLTPSSAKKPKLVTIEKPIVPENEQKKSEAAKEKKPEVTFPQSAQVEETKKTADNATAAKPQGTPESTKKRRRQSVKFEETQQQKQLQNSQAAAHVPAQKANFAAQKSNPAQQKNAAQKTPMPNNAQANAQGTGFFRSWF